MGKGRKASAQEKQNEPNQNQFILYLLQNFSPFLLKNTPKAGTYIGFENESKSTFVFVG